MDSISPLSPDYHDEFLPTRAEWVDFRTILDADHFEDETPELPDSAWYEADDAAYDERRDAFLGEVASC